MIKKIVIIDDDKGVVETVKTSLTKRNYEVLTAAKGLKWSKKILLT
ncbi:MAG: hypothetical protein KAS66_01145 [Candidatus Omnitrophica bacterium]|nr:hypothetical protein [Candidatus Omnitrophota bacterium]